MTLFVTAGGCVGPGLAEAFKDVLAPVAQEALNNGAIDISESAITAVTVNANPLDSLLPLMFSSFVAYVIR